MRLANELNSNVLTFQNLFNFTERGANKKVSPQILIGNSTNTINITLFSSPLRHRKRAIIDLIARLYKGRSRSLGGHSFRQSIPLRVWVSEYGNNVMGSGTGRKRRKCSIFILHSPLEIPFVEKEKEERLLFKNRPPLEDRIESLRPTETCRG